MKDFFHKFEKDSIGTSVEYTAADEKSFHVIKHADEIMVEFFERK